MDFLDTVHYWANEKRRREWLNGFSDLVAWAEEGQILETGAARQFLQEEKERSEEAEQALKWAKELRGLFYRVFFAIAQNEKPAEADLFVLHKTMVEMLSKFCTFVPKENGFQWGCSPKDFGDFHRILWPVVKSAADLLTSQNLHLVKACVSGDCSSLFLDTSKNHRRRWCDMKVCGNRAKARQHYQRRKQATSF